MRRVLITLFIITGFALAAAPAVAQDGDGATGTPTPSETTEAPQSEPPPPPADTTTPPADTSTPPADTSTPPTETPGPDVQTPGPDQNSGSDKSGGSGGSTPGAGGSTAGPNLMAAALASEVPISGPLEGKTVRICSPNDPGTFSTVSAQSVVDGHGSGGDIIEPFSWDGGSYPGMNWGIGQAIYNNNCTFPGGAPAPDANAADEVCGVPAEAVAVAAAAEGEEVERTELGCEELIGIQAAQPKVTICHSTSAENNPYVTNKPNASGDIQGHADHTGGIFPDDPWGDIIPPFDFGPGAQFDGLNWTPEGQAIYFNGCNIPGDEEPPPPGEEKVTICHADANPKQPYGPGPISPSVNAIVNPNGHGEHTGPVFFEGIQEQWGDIIPPFEYGDNESFPGLNWDADGQAIYFNDCQVPGDEEEECPEESEDEDSDGESDGDGDVRTLDDDEESDEECDEDDDDDGDDGDEDGDDPDKALPDTGGSSLWILLVGGLLTVFGMAILTNRESMDRIGLFGPVPLDAPSVPWSFTFSRDAGQPILGRHTKR